MDLNVEHLEKIIEEVHLSTINLRKKLKLLKLDNTEESLLIKSEKQWFVKRNISSISIENFFELIFKEALQKKRLHFSTKTISFDETDARDLGVSFDTQIHILDFFKMIPELK
jgi:hypothetical protein